MPTELITYTTDAEWHALRASCITSTECAALFGMHPRWSIFEFWHEKRAAIYEGRVSQIEENDRIEAGRFFEPGIAAWTAHRYGLVVEPFKVFALDRAARIGSSFDFRVIGITDTEVADESMRDMFRAHGPGIVECKNVDFLVYREKWTDEDAPDHIEAQVQHQLEASEYGWSCLAGAVAGNRLVTFCRPRNRRVGAGIRAQSAKFWASMDANEPPEPVMPGDAAYVIALHDQATDDKTYDARGDAWFAEQMTHYRQYKGSIAACEELCEMIQAEVLLRIGDASRILVDGGTISAKRVKDDPGLVVTQAHVGQSIGARSGFRRFQFYPKKEKTA